ncbi:MAG: DegT/DnrJ/EryC1/StrS family aminotransferase [Alphaproteobacteria bacterium]
MSQKQLKDLPKGEPPKSETQPFLPFAKPSISEAAIQEVVDCLRSGWITTGPRVQQFEEALKAYLGAPHVLCVSSGTAGLYMSFVAIGLEPGDEVITTPLTFAATLNTIVLAGARPVLVDVDPKTYNLDMNAVEAAITPRTKGILPVHFAGLPVDTQALYALAQKHGLRVIEDAAHAIGSAVDGRRIGGFGDVQIFSFHPNKNMTTGEGGCIAVRDETLLRKLQALRFHGIDRPAWDRFTQKGSQHYDVILPAHKFNMMDLQAALGLHQLKALDGFIEKRNALAQRYVQLLGALPQLKLPPMPPKGILHNWHLFAPLIQPGGGLSRDEVAQRLKEHYGIGTGIHYVPPHTYSYYQHQFGFKVGQFPEAERIGEQILSLPLFPDMTEADQDRVVEALEDIWR